MYFRKLSQSEPTEVPFLAVGTVWKDVHVCAGKFVILSHMTGQDFNFCLIRPVIKEIDDIPTYKEGINCMRLMLIIHCAFGRFEKI